MYTDELTRFPLWLYAIDERGRFAYRSASDLLIQAKLRTAG